MVVIGWCQMGFVDCGGDCMKSGGFVDCGSDWMVSDGVC